MHTHARVMIAPPSRQPVAPPDTARHHSAALTPQQVWVITNPRMAEMVHIGNAAFATRFRHANAYQMTRPRFDDRAPPARARTLCGPTWQARRTVYGARHVEATDGMAAIERRLSDQAVVPAAHVATWLGTNKEAVR